MIDLVFLLSRGRTRIEMSLRGSALNFKSRKCHLSNLLAILVFGISG